MIRQILSTPLVLSWLPGDGEKEPPPWHKPLSPRVQPVGPNKRRSISKSLVGIKRGLAVTLYFMFPPKRSPESLARLLLRFQFFQKPPVAPGCFRGLAEADDGRWRRCCRRRSVSVRALLCAGFLCGGWNAQPAWEVRRVDVTHCSAWGFPSNLFAVSPGCSNTRELQGFTADKGRAGRP